jgi:hypothetical protein
MLRYPLLSKWYKILSTSKDRNGTEYVSTIEGTQYPFFGQWYSLAAVVKSIAFFYLMSWFWKENSYSWEKSRSLWKESCCAAAVHVKIEAPLDTAPCCMA